MLIALPPLEVLQATAAPLFRDAVADAMANPSTNPPTAYHAIRRLIPDPKAYGFHCAADAFAAVVPRASRLTLDAWSRERIELGGCAVDVSVRPFAIMQYGACIELRSPDRSPLPVSETGFKSLHTPFAVLAAAGGLLAYLADLFPEAPRQARLF